LLLKDKKHLESRDGNLAQVVGGQGALMRPECIRGSMQTKHAAELQRRKRSKAE